MIDRSAAQQLLQDAELVPCMESNLPSAKELERECFSRDIPVLLAKPPAKACCGSGGCGCGAKVQVLVREADLPKIATFFHDEWRAAAEAEGLVPLNAGAAAPGEEGDPPCPACGTAAPLVDGACSDCGLQLE
jgi:hypothetical protein